MIWQDIKVLSHRGKENQSKNVHPHYLGSRGYDGAEFKKRLKASQWLPASSCGSTLSGNTSDISVSCRHAPWVVAREKVGPDGKPYIPNEKTRKVAGKIEELQVQHTQGTFVPHRYNDVLGAALPNKEHPGRVRGFGSYVGWKTAFTNDGSRNSQSTVQSEEVAEMKEKLKWQEEKQALLEMEIANLRNIVFSQSMGSGVVVETNTLENSPGVHLSSCHSVEPPHPLDSIEDPLSCTLCLVRNGNNQIVAKVTIFPSGEGTLLHYLPLPSGTAKVMVDFVFPGESGTPLPVPSDELATLGDAEGTCTAWPKDLVVLGEEPPHEVVVGPTSGKSVQSDVAAPPTKITYENIDVSTLGPDFKDIRDRVLRADPGFQYWVIFLPPDLFIMEEEMPIMVTCKDVLDLMMNEWLDVTIIQTFLLFMYKHCEEYEIKSIGFLDPGKINSTYLTNYKEATHDYMVNALLAQREKRLIFMPFHQGQHWILYILMPKDNIIYKLDSDERTSRQYHLRKHINDAFRVFNVRGGSARRSTLRYKNITCPQQPENWECAYYVMNFIHDIITTHIDSFPKVEGTFATSYSSRDVDNIRRFWGKIFRKQLNLLAN